MNRQWTAKERQRLTRSENSYGPTPPMPSSFASWNFGAREIGSSNLPDHGTLDLLTASLCPY